MEGQAQCVSAQAARSSEPPPLARAILRNTSQHRQTYNADFLSHSGRRQPKPAESSTREYRLSLAMPDQSWVMSPSLLPPVELPAVEAGRAVGLLQLMSRIR